MIKIFDKSDCCGCTACAMSCPVRAIHMKEDKEGFLYPIIDEKKCIRCNKCEKVCPINKNSVESDYSRKVYVCQNKNVDIRFDSTSGGFFSAVSNYVLKRNGYVIGAEFDGEWNVVHGKGSTPEDLARFRGSKYIQSKLGDVFIHIKQLLDNNEWVLFSGTPCQVEGLVSYLNKNYEKLILMDIVCFSISSPKVWRFFLSYLEKNKKLEISKINKIKFRDKTKYGYEYTLMSFYDKNGRVLYSSGPESNKMLRSFVSNTSTRLACYKCRFKKIKRVSDFTAWDCYNVYQYNKEADDNKGTSHVMIHSQKAAEILEELKDDLWLKEVNLEAAVKSEPAMIKCATPSKERSLFFKCVERGENPFEIYFNETLRTKGEKILRKIFSTLGIYKIIKRSIKKLQEGEENE